MHFPAPPPVEPAFPFSLRLPVERVSFPLAALLSGPIGLGSMGIWLSWPVGWTIGALLSLVFYFAGVWKRTADIA